MQIAEILDIRGEKCPNTFLYTKIKLEELSLGDGGVLKVILDYPPAVENISTSIKSEKWAYRILDVKNVEGNTYELLIEAPSKGD
jgi:TusA-related sulfurtransferase|tara:strand:+ start:1102 stop:1356 length:255 start_codon:yes stop_codon:yes gene_type:complete